MKRCYVDVVHFFKLLFEAVAEKLKLGGYKSEGHLLLYGRTACDNFADDQSVIGLVTTSFDSL